LYPTFYSGLDLLGIIKYLGLGLGAKGKALGLVFCGLFVNITGCLTLIPANVSRLLNAFPGNL